MSEKFKRLIEYFTKLPGVGPRQATRFALSMLNKGQTELDEFGDAIKNLKSSIKICQDCFYISETDKCYICLSSKRDRHQVMVVEKITDLEAIERTGLYHGLYHVLGGAINPPEGVNPEHLNIEALLKRIESIPHNPELVELILATSPTTYGDTTALYIEEEIKKSPLASAVKISRLARGIASGSLMEYVDELTLKEALNRRI